MEIDQTRDYKQTWNSLQKYINVFPLGNNYTDIRYTL